MKTFAEKTVVTEELAGICCNVCGRALNKDEFGYFEDYISFSKKWGYHSPKDGETHMFDVCADCYLEWIKTFNIPPNITEA